MSEPSAVIDTEREPQDNAQNSTDEPKPAAAEVDPQPPVDTTEAKAEEPKAEEAPTEEPKAEETPAEETKAEETPAEEAKAEAAPAEEAPAEEAKAEETPAEKSPAESTAEAAGEEKAAAEAKPKKKAPKPLSKRDREVLTKLEKALADKEPIEGRVIGWNKGGYHVVFESLPAFCPVSQIEVGNPRSPKRYVDKTFPFLVLEIQRGGRRIVVSRAEALKIERERRAADARERLQPGTEIEGKVSSLTDFGAFVDLGGGIEGLVHISEISRQRVEHPKELLKVGQEVKVVVLKLQKGGERISLSMKKFEPDPWDGIAERYPAGTPFTGVIKRKADFGLFVEVEPGLEGLVHTSRLPIGVTLSDESLEEGKTIEGWVQNTEPKRRRLSLSLREVQTGDPWADVTSRFPAGTVVEGRVERLARFGAFIEIEPGLTGLLPFSVLPQGPNINLRRQYHPGKEVKVQVLDVDPRRKRISLGTEGSTAEGSPTDYREYMKKQGKEEAGLNTLAAAFAKLRGEESSEA